MSNVRGMNGKQNMTYLILQERKESCHLGEPKACQHQCFDSPLINKPSSASRGPSVAYRQDKEFGLQDHSLSRMSTLEM